MSRSTTAHCHALDAGARGFLEIRKFKHAWGSRTLIMGIVNVTPDSFSGDGVVDTQGAVKHALEQYAEGADIIDVGGESTRPGYQAVSAQTEVERVRPVVEKIRELLPEAIISLDTTKSKVLKSARGVDLLNSIWGITDDLLQTAIELNLPIVIMHNKDKPAYDLDVMDEVLSYLEEHAARAILAGMKTENIILDPGIGFGKLPEHNLQILNQLHRLVALGFPTLLGTSRKSFIGKVTGKAVQERLLGTAATVALAISSGIDIVRVHDVEAMRDVVDVSDAIIRGVRPKDWLENG